MPLLLALCSIGAKATDDNAHNAFSPYSIFGVGNIVKQGSAYNKSMGGVGIASRNKGYINFLNPAAVASRDTLSFMADISASLNGTSFSQSGRKTFNNDFNIGSIAFSFPIYRKSAFLIGITPFSDVAFDFSSREKTGSLAETNIITRAAHGDGGIYQIMAGPGATFGKWSVGAQALYYFGKIDKKYTYNFTSSSSNSIYTGYTMQLNGMSAKLGVQYETTLSSGLTLTAGVTHRFPTRLHGEIRDYQYAVMSSVTDTLRNDTLSLSGSKVKLASETGIGISLRKGDKWMVEIDYLFSSWKNTGIGNATGFANGNSNTVFTPSVSHSIRAGVEYTPNKNDIRYYLRRCAYRAGVYYDKAYFKAGGHSVNTMGLTLGITLPIFRLNNGLTLGVDLGQRGTTTAGLVKERFLTFSVGFNIHDIWFKKPQYD